MILRKIILTLIFVSSVLSASDLRYTDKNENSLSSLLSKKTYLSENLSFKFNIMSAYALLSERETKDSFLETRHKTNLDEVLFTLSYQF